MTHYTTWHFGTTLFMCPLIISEILHLPLLAVKPLILIQLYNGNTKVGGSKAITIMKHYHSSSSITTGNNDHLPAPEIAALTDIRPKSNN